MGNKTGHTNVCVFSDVFVCTRGALGMNPREREIAEEKKEDTGWKRDHELAVRRGGCRFLID